MAGPISQSSSTATQQPPDRDEASPLAAGDDGRRRAKLDPRGSYPPPPAPAGAGTDACPRRPEKREALLLRR